MRSSRARTSARKSCAETPTRSGGLEFVQRVLEDGGGVTLSQAPLERRYTPFRVISRYVSSTRAGSLGARAPVKRAYAYWAAKLRDWLAVSTPLRLKATSVRSGKRLPVRGRSTSRLVPLRLDSMPRKRLDAFAKPCGYQARTAAGILHRGGTVPPPRAPSNLTYLPLTYLLTSAVPPNSDPSMLNNNTKSFRVINPCARRKERNQVLTASGSTLDRQIDLRPPDSSEPSEAARLQWARGAAHCKVTILGCELSSLAFSMYWTASKEWSAVNTGVQILQCPARTCRREFNLSLGIRSSTVVFAELVERWLLLSAVTSTTRLEGSVDNARRTKI
ncbi:hypothetical protein FB451DRAFT_1193583 [Mycena latifolia]|nr:hypothetical protein FB451DRAFT_1193583 [Mycena latifolia]